MSITSNANIKGFTTFDVSYTTNYFLEISDSSLLHKELSDNNLLNADKIFLGEGSNILFTKDYPGVIIKVSENYIKIASEDSEYFFLTASGSFKWHDLVVYAIDKGLYGAENLSLIPGSVGGAVVQNIGAYGVELSEIVDSVRFIDVLSGKEAFYNKTECEFAYRYSIFKEKKNLYIKEVTFKLSKKKYINLSYAGLRDRIMKKFVNIEVNSKQISQTVCEIREEKLISPKELPNAGSFFKNPIVSNEKIEKIKINYPDIVSFYFTDSLFKISAGWLIEKVGLKGIIINHAGTSPKHALILVKYPKGNGHDVINFANLVKQKVSEKFEIELESEVEIF